MDFKTASVLLVLLFGVDNFLFLAGQNKLSNSITNFPRLACALSEQPGANQPRKRSRVEGPGPGHIRCYLPLGASMVPKLHWAQCPFHAQHGPIWRGSQLNSHRCSECDAGLWDWVSGNAIHVNQHPSFIIDTCMAWKSSHNPQLRSLNCITIHANCGCPVFFEYCLGIRTMMAHTCEVMPGKGQFQWLV